VPPLIEGQNLIRPQFGGRCEDECVRELDLSPGADLSSTRCDGIGNRLDASERPQLTLDGAALLRADAVRNDQSLGKCHGGQQ